MDFGETGVKFKIEKFGDQEKFFFSSRRGKN